MSATELASIFSTNRHVSRVRRPVFASNRPRHRRFGPLRASEGLDAGPPEIHQPPQVVAGGHLRYSKARSRLTDRADQLAAHLIDGAEHMLDPGARLGDAPVAPLPAPGQRLVAQPLALDLIAIAVGLEPRLARLGRIAMVGMDIATRVERVEHVLEVLAVVGAGRSGPESADDLVLRVDVDREFVAKVALAVFPRPGCVSILLAALGRLQRPARSVRSLGSRVALRGRRYQRGIDDLPTARNETALEQLCRYAVKERPRPRCTDAVLEGL